MTERVEKVIFEGGATVSRMGIVRVPMVLGSQSGGVSARVVGHEQPIPVSVSQSHVSLVFDRTEAGKHVTIRLVQAIDVQLPSAGETAYLSMREAYKFFKAFAPLLFCVAAVGYFLWAGHLYKGGKPLALEDTELQIPSDSGARFFVLEKSGTGAERTIVTKRVGTQYTSYSKRLYNCDERTVKYLGDGDTLEKMAVSKADPQMGPNVEDSIAYYVGIEACK